jgi:histidinol-phosphate aminotransferase
MYSWENNIRKVEPYVPGEQPKDLNIIKLNTNENPYGPSPMVRKMISELDPDLFRRYPDARASELVDTLAAYHNVKPEQVFVGVGSDDVLGMCFMTFFNSDKEIIFPDITYSFYPVWAEMMRIPYKVIPLNDNFVIDSEEYKIPNGGIVIANPNAPTSILLEREKVIDIISSNPDSIVIVDEAYIDFAPNGSSVIDMVDTYDNLIVVRTYSKSRSMAGMRIGYAVAGEPLIKYLNDVKYSYNSYTMNMPSIILGKASIEDEDYFRETIEKVVETREWFAEELCKLNFKVPVSATNFVFASPSGISAKEIFERLKEVGIYVRYFNLPRIDNYLRISIGRREDMEKVIAFLKDLC